MKGLLPDLRMASLHWLAYPDAIMVCEKFKGVVDRKDTSAIQIRRNIMPKTLRASVNFRLQDTRNNRGSIHMVIKTNRTFWTSKMHIW